MNALTLASDAARLDTLKAVAGIKVYDDRRTESVRGTAAHGC